MRSKAWEGDYSLTQQFGVNPSLYGRFNLAGHNGADFALPLGTTVYALRDGVITEVAGDPGGYGLYVKLRDREGGDWLYAHLGETGSTLPGDEVVAGTPIATSGSTGNSTGPHLHLGYRPWPPRRGWPYDGYVDPVPFLLRDPP